MAKKTDKPKDAPNPRRGGSYTVQPDGSLKKNESKSESKPTAKPEKPSADTSDGGDSGGN